MIHVESLPWPFPQLPNGQKPAGSFGKTWSEFFQATEAATSDSSCTRWQNAGIWDATGFLTLRALEPPNAGVACSLSAIAETVAPQSTLWLSTKQVQRLHERLLRGGKTPWPEVMAMTTDGRATRRQSGR